MYKRPVYGLEDMAKLSMGLGVSNIQKGDAKVRTGFELGLNIWSFNQINIHLIDKWMYLFNRLII